MEKLELYKQKVGNLKRYQLVGIYLDSFLSSLNLEFTYGLPKEDKIFRFTNILGFAISKVPEDDEGCFSIYEVSIDIFDRTNKNIILLKNVEIKKRNHELFHFSVDGGARVEVIFGYLHFFEAQDI